MPSIVPSVLKWSRSSQPTGSHVLWCATASKLVKGERKETVNPRCTIAPAKSSRSIRLPDIKGHWFLPGDGHESLPVVAMGSAQGGHQRPGRVRRRFLPGRLAQGSEPPVAGLLETYPWRHPAI